MRHRLFLLALSTGCTPAVEDPVPPPVVWEGEHVRFGRDADGEFCAGTLAHMDRYVGALKQRLGAPDDLQVEYYWMDDPEAFCGEYSSCSVDNRAFSVRPLSHHEIVHAVRRESSYPFIEEGIATAWGVIHSSKVVPDRGQLQEAIEDPGVPEDYELAADFTSFLLADWGDENFVELSRAVPNGVDFAGFRETFDSVYDLSLDEAVEAYGTYAACEPKGFVENVEACGDPAVTITCGPGVEHEVDMRCDGEQVASAGDLMFTTVTIEIPEEGEYEVYLEGEPGVSTANTAWLRECGSGCRDVRDVGTYTWGDFQVHDLPEGTYVLTVTRAPDEGVPLTLHCEPFGD